ncbi:MAG: MFS multidrug transporter [Lasallia pustulata]|uniref:MFS multidrug transporter n=1 Tax=Lasallia pustulata TaxID=136370 RepID=A0A5M8PWK3_9LECA|nr:MAG: MFS multidrug transporter [Lasallia pustulata]
MSASVHSRSEPSPPPDEQSPLLSNGKTQDQDNRTLEHGADRSEHGDGETDVPIAEEPSTAKLLVVLSSVWLGCFLAALDSTIIATLSAPISTSFNSLSLLSWLASAYLIANAALQPISGRLTDILSRRTGLIFSNVCFAIGNLICGLATREWVMILGRVVAGMGGGGLTAISTFVASDLVPLRKRGMWQGFGNVCYGVGAGIGGVFGGWVNDVWGWRVAFLVQVPFTVISGILVFFTVKVPVKQTEKSPWERIDFLGATTMIVTLVLLLLGLNSGGNIVPWTHPLVLTTLPLSAIFAVIFVYVESYIATEPVIPVKLMLNRTVFAACLTNWFTSMALYALLFYGPIYFQVKGFSTTQAGIRLVPQAIGNGVGSLGSGAIMRWTGRYYLLNVCVQITFVVSLALVSTFTLASSAWPAFVYFFLTGIGYSGMLTITLLALIAAVDHKHQAVITSASYAFRSTGSTIGITIASAVFQNILKMELWGHFGDRKDAARVIGRVRDSFDEIQHLPPEWKGGVQDVYMDALRGVFLTALGMGVLGSVASLFMREHKLHSNLARK